MLTRRLRKSASLLTTANPSTRVLAVEMIHALDILNGINDSGEIVQFFGLAAIRVLIT